MSFGVSRLGGMSQEQREKLASSVRLLLLWVAASDGDVDESELRFAYQQFPEVEGSMSSEELVAVIRKADVRGLEQAIRALSSESRELRAAFLDLAITMSMADSEIAFTENQILRFYADALYLGVGMLEKRFQTITGKLLQEPGDLGSAIPADENRRDEYDSSCHVLKTIGTLRGRLVLDTGHSWFVENYPDFAQRKGPAFTPPPRPEPRKNDPATTPQAARPSGRAGRSNANHLWIFGLIGLGAALAALAFFLL